MIPRNPARFPTWEEWCAICDQRRREWLDVIAKHPGRGCEHKGPPLRRVAPYEKWSSGVRVWSPEVEWLECPSCLFPVSKPKRAAV